MITLNRVTRTYKTEAGEFAALEAVDLEVRRGEMLAIVGRSGSGKSTLLHLIGGIDRPSSGTVEVGGQPIHTLSEDRLARWRGTAAGIVFQFFQLMPTLTAEENVMLPMDFAGVIAPRERRRRAAALLDRFGVLPHARKLPAGLSGGEQQRVAIARALANDPPLVLADEPTGNLDSTTAQGVFALLRQLADEGKTVLVVSHDVTVENFSDRSVHLLDGRVTERFAFSELAG